jgi:hypothetical protein
VIHDAVTSRRVIIEPFDALAALAARGVTGKVVAGGLLDELSALQDATRSTAAARGLSSAFNSASKDDQPHLLNVWANSINNSGGSQREALVLYRAALRIKPDAGNRRHPGPTARHKEMRRRTRTSRTKWTRRTRRRTPLTMKRTRTEGDRARVGTASGLT